MLILLHLICFIFAACADDPIVETKYGKLKGFKYERKDGGKSDIFLGIPFAKPPVGELRFEKPQPPEAWQGVRSAVEYGHTCFPLNKSVAHGVASENCLTLNVMRPEIVTTSPKLPVLVWIHGGGYAQGSAVMYRHPGFADIYNLHDVITVSIQYRLGFLGFFSDGNEMLGNLGLWDQTFALKFIKENIEAFGGDSEKITIFGLSAGGGSTSQLSLSPHSNKYFTQAISMSGSAWSSWALSDLTIKHSLELADAVGCLGKDDIKSCLKSKSMEELYDGIGIIGGTQYSLNMLKFTPRIDGDFYPSSLENMLKNSKPIPTILGISDRESLFFTIRGLAPDIHKFAIPPSEFQQFDEEKLRKAIKELFANEQYFGNLSEEAFNHIYQEYVEKKKPLNADFRFFLDVYSKLLDETLFNVASAREAAHRIARGDNVYIYRTTHFQSVNFPEDAPVKGATHVVEYSYLFNLFVLGQFDLDHDEVEQRVSKVFRESFINFAKTGIPTNSVVKWEKSDVAHLQFLNISSSPKMETRFCAEDREFWDGLAKKYKFDMITLLKTDGDLKVNDEL